jgi:transposase-like protein
MSTKEALHRRKDIPDDQVEELVARAARIQDDAQRTPKVASESDIAAVAEELDIEPQYVEAAIAQWREEQQSAPAEASRERVKNRGKTAMKGALVIGGATLIGIPLLALAAWVTLGSSALWALGGIAAAALAGLVWLLS